MEISKINLNGFTLLSLEECKNTEGGSEFSEGVVRTIGGFLGFLYQCAISKPIRPSEYR